MFFNTQWKDWLTLIFWLLTSSKTTLYVTTLVERSSANKPTEMVCNPFIPTTTFSPARFPGGMQAWKKYLIRNVSYPSLAIKKNVEGVERIYLIIDKSGTVIDVKAMTGLGYGLAEEAERVIRASPKWIPAKINNKPVEYRFIQNITFELK